jgi:tetratricopeptide (TPR) repeat protein
MARGSVPVVPIDWERQPLVVAGDAPAGAPMSLTAGDGTGLQIVSLKASAVIQDPLAFTEIHLVFRNPEPRPIEGRFEITLPPNATVSRFAMRQQWGWQEGEVVELQKAREAYEDFLHRKVDPALLEKQAGNQFQARVFPIPASGEKEIIFSYSQELVRAKDPYQLYLRGLPEIGRMDLRVLYDKPDEARPGAIARQALELHKVNFKPDRDLTVPLPVLDGGARGLRHEELVTARITPLREAAPDRIASLIVLFDTSASRALGFRAQVARLGRVVEAIRKDMGASTPLAVVAFDQDTETVYSGPAGDFGQRDLDKLLARKPLGASNIARALRVAGTMPAPGGGRFARALLLTDGIATMGDSEAQELRDELEGLKAAGIERLDALVDGGIRDEAFLGNLAGGLAKGGVVLDATLSAPEIAARLASATVSGIRVSVPGSQWTWPAELPGMQPGDQAIVYAMLPKNLPFEVELGRGEAKEKQSVRFVTVERPLLERGAVNAQIRRLMAEHGALSDPSAREAKKAHIIQLSTKYRVLSDFTGLLVLDTDADYARFNIDRTALADIMVVGPSGIELLGRSRPASMSVAGEPRSRPQEPEAEEKPAKDTEATESRSDKKGGAAPDAPPPPPPPAAAPPVGPRPTIRPSRSEAAGAETTVQGGAAGGVVAAAKPSFEAPAEEPMPSPRPPPAPPRSAPAPQPRPAPTSAPGGSPARPLPTNPYSDAPHNAPSPAPRPPREVDRDDEEEESYPAPYEGRFATVMAHIEGKRAKEALSIASAWRDEEPGDALALVALGESYEALGRKDAAARAYGSIIDLFPSRADLRRFAGARLGRLGPVGLELAVDTFRRAVAQRPDHPASHRFLAYALVRSGKPAEAFDAIEAGLRRGYPQGRFEGVPWILLDDVGLIAAAWIRKEPAKRGVILERVRSLGAKLPAQASLRFVLSWETDANDVDFHIRDGRGGHAYYASMTLRSGGELYADVTTGYGPECFAIEGRPRAYPYRLGAHYYSRGPMGYGMGSLQVVEHDGSGGLKFDDRPFVVMTDKAFVNLGSVTGPLKERP